MRIAVLGASGLRDLQRGRWRQVKPAWIAPPRPPMPAAGLSRAVAAAMLDEADQNHNADEVVVPLPSERPAR